MLVEQLGAVLVALAIAACSLPAAPTGPTAEPVGPAGPLATPEVAAGAGPAATGTGSAGAPPSTPTSTPTLGPPRVETVVDGADNPVSLAFAPDGRLYYDELRTGRVRVIEHGRLLPTPFLTVEVVRKATFSEYGLLGLAFDPDFDRNRYVYIFYSEPNRDGSPRRQRLVRYREQAGVGVEPAVIWDDLPVAADCCHNSGRVRFGPDGKLYVAIGDTERPDWAQDPARLAGKILRLNPDGTIPVDNPIPGSPVYAQGLRNPFGLAFHPATGVLFATDNGPPGRLDELNIIRPGGNYGWPVVAGIAHDRRFVDPIWTSGETAIAPTGMTFYTGGLFPEYRNNLFFCGWNDGGLRRMRLAAPTFDRVEAVEVVGRDCQLDVAVGPDGAIYFAGMSAIARLTR